MKDNFKPRLSVVLVNRRKFQVFSMALAAAVSVFRQRGQVIFSGA